MQIRSKLMKRGYATGLSSEQIIHKLDDQLPQRSRGGGDEHRSGPPYNRRTRQFRNGAAHQLSAGLAALARRAAQQPVSSIELPAVSTADIRAEVRTHRHGRGVAATALVRSGGSGARRLAWLHGVDLEANRFELV
jgi:hypothetical protein